MPVRERSRASRSIRTARSSPRCRATRRLGVVAARDDAAVAHHRGRLGRNRARQQVETFGRRCECCVDAGECVRVRDDRADALAQCRERGERVAQARQVARARGQQRETPGDPFDVGDLAQRAAQRIEACVCRCIEQCTDCLLARLRGDRRARRVMQPVPQQAAAHRRAARVEQRIQRRRLGAAQRLGQFEVAARGRIETDVLRFVLDLQAAHVSQLLALRGGRIEQRAGCAARARERMRTETVEARDIELVAQALRARRDVEVPCRYALARPPTGTASVAPSGVRISAGRMRSSAAASWSGSISASRSAAGEVQPCKADVHRDAALVVARAHREQ